VADHTGVSAGTPAREEAHLRKVMLAVVGVFVVVIAIAAVAGLVTARS
jgi:hypothetical protein